MQKHIKNYLNFFKPHDDQNIPCEVCNSKAVDIHHIIPRSKFGKKRKDEQDNVNNLIALCRICHEMAHAEKYSKDYLSQIHLKKINNHEQIQETKSEAENLQEYEIEEN